MKSGILLALLCAGTNTYAGWPDWCWRLEEEPAQKPKTITVKVDELDQLIAATKLLHKQHLVAQAFEQFKKLSNQNKISFLNVLFQLNQFPAFSGLTVEQLQQIADAEHATKVEKDPLKVPAKWKDYLLRNTKQPGSMVS